MANWPLIYRIYPPNRDKSYWDVKLSVQPGIEGERGRVMAEIEDNTSDECFVEATFADIYIDVMTTNEKDIVWLKLMYQYDEYGF